MNRHEEMKQRIYIVEDHADLRMMLVEYLEAMTRCEVTRAVATAEEALRDPYGTDAHLLLIDMALPLRSGIDLVVKPAEHCPELPCLMYSTHHKMVYVRQCLEAGVRGYVLKGRPEELPHAIAEVLAGRMYLSECISYVAEKR